MTIVTPCPDCTAAGLVPAEIHTVGTRVPSTETPGSALHVNGRPRRHHHTPDPEITVYECSNRHTFQTERFTPCWCEES